MARPMEGLDGHDKVLYRLTWLALALSLGHHLDHLIRGNAVGWPVTDQVNAFTASLIVYPIIATGLVLYRAGRVGPGFCAGVGRRRRLRQRGPLRPGRGRATRADLWTTTTHPSWAGWPGWLMVFVTVLAITRLYETRLWALQQRRAAQQSPATGAGTT